MTVEGVDLSTIGVFTLVALPYVWKFLWAPAMDRFVPPFLGRRRGWLLVTQLALASGIAGMAFLSPRTDLVAIAWLALFVAFASAGWGGLPAPRPFSAVRLALSGICRRPLLHRRGEPRRARASRRARCRR